jgi:tetratricopeptide (TPR) repeat protein
MTGSDDLLRAALEHHQAGNTAEAEQMYHAILKDHPDQAEALCFLGILNVQKGNFEPAKVFLQQAVNLIPDYALAHYNLGFLFQQQDKFDEALASYEQTILIQPDFAKTYNNKGIIFQKLGRLNEAMESFKHAVKLQHDYFEAHYNLGNVFQEQGIFDEALSCYEEALALNPDHIEAYFQKGFVLQELGRYEEAYNCFKKVLVIKHDDIDTLNNLGFVLMELGRYEESGENLKKAISIKPDFAGAYNNLGLTLQAQGRLSEAAASYEKAISLKPGYADAYSNLGTALKAQGMFEQALIQYEKAVSLVPDFADAHFNKSVILLLKGRFNEGWAEYEWRLRMKGRRPRSFAQPRWDGASLKGKTILVYDEQGYGDTFQFLRYLPLIKAKGGYIIFECHKKHYRKLLQRIKWIDKIIEWSREPSVQFDVHVPLASLPKIFNTTLSTIPADVPYITAEPALVEKWKAKMSSDSHFKIGIVWAGSTGHKEDRARSCSLADLLALTKVKGISLYSLQKGNRAEQALEPPVGMNIINLDMELNDFADTAAVIENLDLVVSVDTAVAHLAGALARPVWTLLPFVPDWRWLLEREDSPWYPTMRLFRQPKPYNWKAVMERVAGELSRAV